MLSLFPSKTREEIEEEEEVIKRILRILKKWKTSFKVK